MRKKALGNPSLDLYREASRGLLKWQFQVSVLLLVGYRLYREYLMSIGLDRFRRLSRYSWTLSSQGCTFGNFRSFPNGSWLEKKITSKCAALAL